MSNDHHFPSETNNGNNNAATNKWSKNGYGKPCNRSGGKFSREETDTVRRAVEEYCATKNISTSRLCSECDHKAELKGAWMEIAKRLPHRTVQSVYRHGLRQLHPFRRGPWTEAECQMLLELVTRMGKKWSAIQSKLNRSADSCRDKFREMSSDYVKGRWKEGETEILKRLIREYLKADPHADIKELGRKADIDGTVIPWSTISKRMGKRSRLSCFKKWQKMTGLYSPSDQHKISAEQQQQQQATSRSVTNTISLPQPIAVSTSVQNGAPCGNPTAASTVTINLPESARNAPTAGAAAAAAAAAAAFRQPPTNNIDEDTTINLYLLTTIANSGVARVSDINWNSIRAIDNPNRRWAELLQEWHQTITNEEQADLSKLPHCDLARVLLNRKQHQQNYKLEVTVEVIDDGTGDLAKMADETVEAVDLPTLNAHAREV